MSNTQRPALQRQHTRTTDEKRDSGLDEGVSFLDEDGTRLNVRVRDVKGSHDAALVAATGLDFMGLLSALSQRQGLDLLSAVVWFGRLVNGRDAGTYESVRDDFGYEDVINLDMDEPGAGDDGAPEASGGS